jgi:hypothetical protein
LQPDQAAELLERALGQPVADRRGVAMAHRGEELLGGADRRALARQAALQAAVGPRVGLLQLVVVVDALACQTRITLEPNCWVTE